MEAAFGSLFFCNPIIIVMKRYSALQLQEKINAYIAKLAYGTPNGLYEPIAYELSLGGKRWARFPYTCWMTWRSQPPGEEGE